MPRRQRHFLLKVIAIWGWSDWRPCWPRCCSPGLRQCRAARGGGLSFDDPSFEQRAATSEAINLSAPFDASGAIVDGASVLVTGGTGSFGQAFVRDVLATGKPKRLIVFSRDEQKQFDMQNELPASNYPSLRFFLGDVRDRDRLQMAMRDVDYVIHAAALKARAGG